MENLPGIPITDEFGETVNSTTQTEASAIMAFNNNNALVVATNNSPLGSSAPQRPGVIVDSMQIIMVAIQASIQAAIQALILASIAPVISGNSSFNQAGMQGMPNLAWLNDLQFNLSTLQKMAKKLVNSGTLGEFISFPKLPAELRALIWSYFLPPRILETYSNFMIHLPRTAVNNPLLTLLHVTQESRAFTLRKYTTLMESISGQAINASTNHFPYFNPSTDTIFIPFFSYVTPVSRFSIGPSAAKVWFAGALATITHLAIDARVWTRWSGTNEIRFNLFPSLKTVTMVLHDAAECTEEWSPTYKGEITFIDSGESKSTAEIDLEIEVRCELLRQKGAEDASVGWEVPKLEIKCLARDGKKCCEKDVWMSS